jgi:hypothetical protein
MARAIVGLALPVARAAWQWQAQALGHLDLAGLGLHDGGNAGAGTDL